MTSLKTLIVAILLLLPASQVLAGPLPSSDSSAQWYKCIVKGGSHTGRYTFKIDTQKCQIYWKEVDAQLKVQSCKLPVMTALKPSARDDLTIVWFDMKTGAFYDYLSGFLDHGWCKKAEQP